MKKLLIRKLYRLILLVVVVIYYYWPQKYVILCVVLAFAFALSLDIIRLTNPLANEVVRKIFRPFARFMRYIAKKEELRDLSGTTYTLMGCAIIIILMPKTIGMTAILFNIFGDLFATVIGKSYGKIKILSGKTLEGSFSCFASMLLVAVWSHYILSLPMIAGLVGAIAGTIIELVPLKLNDNLTIPILSGAVMWLFI
jgi:glycerol-3-phosphate acyltransferase PlsY